VTSLGHWDGAAGNDRVSVGYGQVRPCPIVPTSPTPPGHELHRNPAGTITGFSALAVPERR
jgi:hypothetical protein